MKKSLAHPHRRWKAFPKEEIDGGVLSEAERKAGEMRRKTKQVEGRRKAAKRKKELN